MSYVHEVNLDELDDMTPENIAEVIFSEQPAEKCSLEIIAPGLEMRDIFEVLITILLEGFVILNQGLDDIDIEKVTDDHIRAMNPWFESFGYTIDIQSIIGENPQKHYCRCVLRNTYNIHLFKMNKITKDYHFFINSEITNKEFKSLDEMYATFDTGAVVYRIGFKRCYDIPK